VRAGEGRKTRVSGKDEEWTRPTRRLTQISEVSREEDRRLRLDELLSNSMRDGDSFGRRGPGTEGGISAASTSPVSRTNRTSNSTHPLPSSSIKTRDPFVTSERILALVLISKAKVERDLRYEAISDELREKMKT